MKKISAKVLWLIALGLIIIGAILVFVCSKVPNEWTKTIIVIIAIDFILATFVIQAASFKSFRYKAKNNYPTLEYEGNYDELKKLLLDNKFNEDKHKYGSSFLKIDGDDALKVTLIDDIEYYYNQKENSEARKPNKDLDKCKRFIDIEIFKEIGEYEDRLADFTIQGKNVYFTALLNMGNGEFKCFNYLEPEEEFLAGYNKLFEYLNIRKKQENVGE